MQKLVEPGKLAYNAASSTGFLHAALVRRDPECAAEPGRPPEVLIRVWRLE
jgi:hypothetical protein